MEDAGCIYVSGRIAATTFPENFTWGLRYVKSWFKRILSGQQRTREKKREGYMWKSYLQMAPVKVYRSVFTRYFATGVLQYAVPSDLLNYIS